MTSRLLCPQCGSNEPITGTGCARCRRFVAPLSRHSTPILDQRYELQGTLGEGATGIVYEAIDVRDNNRVVAVKLLRQDILTNSNAVKRFLKEALISSRINHPNVLPVLGHGEANGQYYIVFPRVYGRTLQDQIPATGFADVRRAVRLMTTLLRALHYVWVMHDILHRDIKPGNLISLNHDDQSLYLLDFGLAICHSTNKTKTRLTVQGTVLGTLLYASPEQAAGRLEEIRHTSDLYSVGVVLYHMLTGRVPFTSESPAFPYDLLLSIQESPPPPLRTVRPDLDPRLEAIVLKAMSKSQADRYQTGLEFAEALEAWLYPGSATRSTGKSESVQPAPKPRVKPAVTIMPPLLPPKPHHRPSNRVGYVWLVLMGLLLGTALFAVLCMLLGPGGLPSRP